MYMIGGIFFQKWYIKENGVRPWGRALRVFSHDATAAMLVSQTNPVGVELFSYVKAFFFSNKFA